MSRLSTIPVRTTSRSYAVIVGVGHAAASLARATAEADVAQCPIVTSRPVWRAVGTRLRSFAGASRPRPVMLPDRERAKTWEQVGRIHDAFLSSRLRRNGLVVAIGGGSVGDAAGFAASTYMRGVDWVVVPTTLLSMVDSAVGGKVGVNHRRSKNLAGAFHQPAAVVVDLAFLGTLPRRELRGGSYEILKCALIGDRPLFDALSATGPADTWSTALMRRAVVSSIRLKASVVSKDEREGGLRRVLNLGHTFGHAIEAATGYGRFNHGEAVGHGLVAAAHISLGRGLLSPTGFDRLTRAVGRLGARPSVASLEYSAVRDAMGADKKALSSRPTFILPHGIGRVVIRHDVTESELRSAWNHLKAQ